MRIAASRLRSGDPDDWPTVALALKPSLPVWSQDSTWPTPPSRCLRPVRCSMRWLMPAMRLGGRRAPALRLVGTSLFGIDGCGPLDPVALMGGQVSAFRRGDTLLTKKQLAALLVARSAGWS